MDNRSLLGLVWLKSAYAKLTFEIVLVNGDVFVGNSGFIIDMYPGFMAMNFFPGGSRKHDDGVSIRNSLLFCGAFTVFLDWYGRTGEYKNPKRQKLQGTTNPQMYKFRQRILDEISPGSLICTGSTLFGDGYEINMAKLHQDYLRAVGGRREDYALLRLSKRSRSLEGRITLKRPI